ncbi:MAG TPA: DUF4340 domain-containing protein [Thermoanaerobaculia bacterium]|jgi:hypothetical protein|nr:DUF4340 domain-containing protein [Thermoanaerobaculia bacterium]
MKPRTLLILLLLVVGLGSFIAFFERKMPSSEEREHQAKKVFSFGPGDVRSLAIERAGPPLAFERIEKPKETKPDKAVGETSDEAEPPTPESVTAADWSWRIVHPIAARADAASVGRLVDSLAGLERSGTIENVDAKATGLDRPEAKVRLKTPEGETVLEIGAKVPVGGERIVRIQGRTEAYSVPDAFWNDLLREPGAWRDKQVFAGDREAIERITIRPSGVPGAPAASEVVLARHADGFWLERPIADRADRDLVEALLSDLTGLAADRFVESPAVPAEMGLEPPKGTIEVASKGQAQAFRLDLGGSVGAAAEGEAPATYARAGGQLFTTKSRVAEALMRGSEDWRSHAVSSIEVYQVDSLQVRDDLGSFDVKRAGSDWQRGKETISYTPVSDLLYAISELRAEKLTDGLPNAFGKSTLTITLAGAEGRKETLHFYPDNVARPEGRLVSLVLPAGKLAEIQAKVADVRKEKPVPKGAPKP